METQSSSGRGPDLSSDLAALLHWWALSGVDEAVADAPIDWFRYGQRTATAVAPPAATPTRGEPVLRAAPAIGATTAVEHWPDTLPEFLRWLSDTPDLLECKWPGRRFSPRGNPDSRILILTDHADPMDQDSGEILSGVHGALMANMMAACGVTIDDCFVAPLCTIAPPGGLIPSDAAAVLGARARHFIALSRANVAVICGDQTSRALRAADAASGVKNPSLVNATAANVRPIMIAHPRILTAHPREKASTWRNLRALPGLLHA